MKKLFLSSSILAATSLFSLAYATSGTIQFTGQLTAASCTVNGGGGGSTPIAIPVNLGTIAIGDLSDGNGSSFGNTTTIPIKIECSDAGGLNSVAMQFSPSTGSGVDPVDGRLLKITAGGAKGVGIGIINSDDTLIDMSGTAKSLSVPLVMSGGPAPAPETGTADIVLRAAYIKAAAPGAATTAGPANGTLPFILTYL